MNGDDIRKRLRVNLRRLRERKGMSQLFLATQVGLAHNFINDVENGKKWVSPDTIAKLSVALDTDPYQLFIPETPLANGDTTLIEACFDDLESTLHSTIQDVKRRHLGD